MTVLTHIPAVPGLLKALLSAYPLMVTVSGLMGGPMPPVTSRQRRVPIVAPDATSMIPRESRAQPSPANAASLIPTLKVLVPPVALVAVTSLQLSRLPTAAAVPAISSRTIRVFRVRIAP